VKHYVYILRSILRGLLYVGTTNDVERRVRQHNAGYSRSTAPYRPYELVYVEEHTSLAEARKREWHLKCTPAGGKERRRLIAGG
jgi:putative endonuclease